MKELMITWVEDHQYEHEDGTWSRADNQGNPVGPHFKTYDELYHALWDYITDNPEACLPMDQPGRDE